MRTWLIEYRTKKGLTQEETATKCGISRQYYSFIESGERNCPVKTAKKIAEVLDFPWTKFFDETTEKEAT
jgi:transcriptional regulator with XRE-family HTH domain